MGGSKAKDISKHLRVDRSYLQIDLSYLGVDNEFAERQKKSFEVFSKMLTPSRKIVETLDTYHAFVAYNKITKLKLVGAAPSREKHGNNPSSKYGARPRFMKLWKDMKRGIINSKFPRLFQAMKDSQLDDWIFYTLEICSKLKITEVVKRYILELETYDPKIGYNSDVTQADIDEFRVQVAKDLEMVNILKRKDNEISKLKMEISRLNKVLANKTNGALIDEDDLDHNIDIEDQIDDDIDGDIEDDIGGDIEDDIDGDPIDPDIEVNTEANARLYGNVDHKACFEVYLVRFKKMVAERLAIHGKLDRVFKHGYLNILCPRTDANLNGEMYKMENSGTSVIYCVWNVITGLGYVGKGFSFVDNGNSGRQKSGARGRFHRHWDGAFKAKPDCPKFYEAIRNSSISDWFVQTLYVCPTPLARDAEKYFTILLKTAYAEYGYNYFVGDKKPVDEKYLEEYTTGKVHTNKSRSVGGNMKRTDGNKEIPPNISTKLSTDETRIVGYRVNITIGPNTYNGCFAKSKYTLEKNLEMAIDYKAKVILDYDEAMRTTGKPPPNPVKRPYAKRGTGKAKRRPKKPTKKPSKKPAKKSAKKPAKKSAKKSSKTSAKKSTKPSTKGIVAAFNQD